MSMLGRRSPSPGHLVARPRFVPRIQFLVARVLEEGMRQRRDGQPVDEDDEPDEPPLPTLATVQDQSKPLRPYIRLVHLDWMYHRQSKHQPIGAGAEDCGRAHANDPGVRPRAAPDRLKERKQHDDE
jgi:hypothetical protein